MAPTFFFARLALLAGALACARAQDEPPAEGSDWLMEGGDVYREGYVEYDGSADARGAARFFYYSLNEGALSCTKDAPDTASGTPVSFGGYWVVGDCINQLLGFKSLDASSASGGKMAPAWTFKPTLPPGFGLVEPRWATPVIDGTSGAMYALLKWEADAQLYGLQLNGAAAPTLVWTLDLKSVTLINSNGNVATFRTWSQEHAIFLYGGKVWVPSNDFDGALIVTPCFDAGCTPTYIITDGQWADTHRMYGSVASRGGGWTQPVFVVHGSSYGIQQYDPATGVNVAADVAFEPSSGEFSHPVAVRFAGNAREGPYRYDCVVATEFDPKGGLYIAAAETTNMTTCGYWSTNGYYVRSKAFALPRWVSAPAVLYDGAGTVTLFYAVQLNNGNAPDGFRSGWRTAVVGVQVDQSGPYLFDLDYAIYPGVRVNAAPVILRDAWGAGRHAVAVGASDGALYLFRSNNLARGPYLDHQLSSLLPASSARFNNLFAGVSGNYLAATEQGSIAAIMHNGTFGASQEFWFVVVTVRGGGRAGGARARARAGMAPSRPPRPPLAGCHVPPPDGRHADALPVRLARARRARAAEPHARRVGGGGQGGRGGRGGRRLWHARRPRRRGRGRRLLPAQRGLHGGRLARRARRLHQVRRVGDVGRRKVRRGRRRGALQRRRRGRARGRGRARLHGGRQRRDGEPAAQVRARGAGRGAALGMPHRRFATRGARPAPPAGSRASPWAVVKEGETT